MKNNDDPFGPFDLNDFRKWMNAQQEGKSKTNMIGIKVESKIPFKRLVSRIEIQNGDTDDVIKEFKSDGGIVADIDGNKFLIEVDSGSFITHKMNIKKKD